jgi:hypothetical protein
MPFRKTRLTFRSTRVRHENHPCFLSKRFDTFQTQAAAPESRAPGGEARLRLALEGVHPLHRGDVWCEALDADGKRDACSVSYDAYLDRGACDEAMASARDAIRRDAENAFACHPRFARVVERKSFPYLRSCSSFKDVGDDGQTT